MSARTITFKAFLLGSLVGVVAPAFADTAEDLAKAEAAYRAAQSAEKTDKESAQRAEADVTRAANEASALAEKQNTAWDQAMTAVNRAKEQLGAILAERGEAQLRIAKAQDASRQARRIYDDARPVYEVRGRSEQLADIPEWQLIERNASDAAAEARRVAAEEQEKIAAIDRRLDEKKDEILKLQDDADNAIALANPDPLGGWLQASLSAAEARRKAAAAEAAVAAAFDGYAARLGTVRPPFLEAVSANGGGQPLYDGVWRRDRTVEDDNAARRAEVRSALLDLTGTINDKLAEREKLRQLRLETAQKMHPLSLAIERYEVAKADAEVYKIASAAVIEAAGSMLEIYLTGGVAPALRAAEALAEQKVANTAARRLAEASTGLAEDAAAAQVRRFAATRARELAAEGAELAKKLESLAVETARLRRASLAETETAIAYARSQVAKALKSLESTDPVVRAAAIREAETLFGVKAAELANALTQLGAGKPGSNYLANKYGPAGSANAETAGIVVGDVIEQGIARTTAYAFSTTPEAFGAARTAIAAARAQGSNWRAVKDGTATLVRGGANWKNAKDAFGGSVKGNLVTLATTATKAAVTKYFAQRQYIFAEAAARVSAEWAIENETAKTAYRLDNEVAASLLEDRRIYAELAAYAALLDGPRKLEPTDAQAEIAADANLEITLRFSTALTTPPVATLAGVPLQFARGAAREQAVWKAVVARSALPADAENAPLVVSLPAGASPGAPLDANPATPARPDPRTPIRVENGQAVVAWDGLDTGEDRNHTISLGDAWTGLWARGDTRIRIVRSGNDITGKLEAVSAAARSERGYDVGQEVLRGSISNHREAQVQMLARYDRSWREKCASASAEYWSPGSYKVEAGTLTGRWEDRQLDDGCKVVERVQQNDSLTKIRAPR